VAKEKTFPFEFEAKRATYFHPAEIPEVTGDILEIGPGHGDLLLWHAYHEPNRHCVGLELSLWRYRKLIKRVERWKLTNVTLVRGDARILLPRHFHTPCFERIYVLFPDPWPKPRHSFHRLLNVGIITHLASILKPGGDIILATDIEPYAAWALANAALVPTLKIEGDPFYHGPYLIPSGEQTWFESLWRQQGKDIFYAKLVKP
jgi:tRNA (guanine-N7-)-methyltransferase